MKPSVATERLGVLLYDDELDWWAGALPAADPPVTLHILPDADGGPDASVATAVAFARELEGWRSRATTFATSRCLEDYNGAWCEPGDEITAEAFASRIRLESIGFYPGGEFELAFADGGLFAGHTILVPGGLADGFEDAYIAR